MLPARGETGRKWTVCGVRTTWNTIGDGEFFCPGCGGDRNYRRRTGRRRFTLLGVPLLPRGLAGPVVECGSCRERFGTEVLEHPTCTRFSAMLRDAVHTVALAVLAAGGTGSRTALEAAAATVRAAGSEECTEEELAATVDALAVDSGRLSADMFGAALSIELHEALEPLSAHLAPAGRESVLLQGARIALSDGPYSPAEREVLSTVGTALRLTGDDVARLLAGVRASG
ncbi:TerB family tellurite resistance protein [Streptomyces bambusae]|uniref:TerB family tellurite resistance protein n=1 Tax=Streptomyces bambusae TaxID=1550616 RepID=UPI003556F3A1